MSNLDRFLDEGASTCAGSLVFRNVEVGVLRDGDLHLNDAGKEALAQFEAVTDVVVKSLKPAKAKKAEVEVPVLDAEAQLDALLAS